MTRGAALILVLLSAFAVASCGRKGDPRLPSSVSDTYPAGYPAGAPTKNENIFKPIQPE